MNALATLINMDQNSANLLHKDAKNLEKSENINDFLTILFSKIKDDEKSIIDLKPTVPLKDNTIGKISKKDDDDKTFSVDKLLLGDILSIINLLKSGTDKKNFPKFSDKLEKILNSVSVKNDFKNIKNIDDLLKLSKKYDLGLKDIELSKVEIKTLKKEFPKLDMEKFFDTENNAIKPAVNQKDKTELKIKNLTIPFKKIPNKETEKKNFQKNPLKSYLKTIDTKEKVEAKQTKAETDTFHKDAIKTLHVESNVAKILQEETTPKKVVVEAIDKKDDVIKEKKKAITKGLSETKAETDTFHKDTIKTLHVESNVAKILQKETTPKEVVVKVADKEDDVAKEKKKAKLKTTTLNEVKKEKLQTSQNFQDTLLHKIKSHKQSDHPNQLQSQKDIQDNSDIQKSKTTKSEHIEQKHEFKTSTLTQNSKTVKHTEVKSSLNHFSTDLKEKIESYKPPITRLKMVLNPKNLGEVEVTLIHRGNNLHVNITSNTNTMTLFNQNQAEFKNSLVNMGFTNLEMNFSDQSKNGQQNQKNNKKNGASFEELQTQENGDSSVELVIPRYI